VLNVRRVADIVGCHPNTVYRLIADGSLPSFRIGHALRVRTEDLDAFMANGGAR
jgi:excisionase family DNA binding protein